MNCKIYKINHICLVVVKMKEICFISFNIYVVNINYRLCGDPKKKKQFKKHILKLILLKNF